MVQTNYSKLIKPNPIKVFCIYCKGPVYESYDIYSIAPPWYRDLRVRYIYDKIPSYHQECNDEFEKAKYTISGFQLIGYLESTLQTKIFNKTGKNFEISDNYDDFENYEEDERNWYEIYNDKIIKLHLYLNYEERNIPEIIFNFKDLYQLSLFNVNTNRSFFKSLMSTIQTFKNLRSLTLHFNEKISFCLCNLNFPQIKTFNLINGRIQCSENIFTFFPNLRELRLNNSFVYADWSRIKPNDKLKILKLENSINDDDKFRIDYSLLPGLIEVKIEGMDLNCLNPTILTLKNLELLDIRNNSSFGLYQGLYFSFGDFIDRIVEINSGSDVDKQLITEMIYSGSIKNFQDFKVLFEMSRVDLNPSNIVSTITKYKANANYFISKIKGDLESYLQLKGMDEEQIKRFLEFLLSLEKEHCGWYDEIDYYLPFGFEEITEENIFDMISKIGHVCYFYNFNYEVFNNSVKKYSKIPLIDLKNMEFDLICGNTCQSELENEDRAGIIWALEWEYIDHDWAFYYNYCKKSQSFALGTYNFENDIQFGFDNLNGNELIILNSCLLEIDLTKFKNEDELFNFCKTTNEDNFLERYFIIFSQKEKFNFEIDLPGFVNNFKEFGLQSLQNFGLTLIEAKSALYLLKNEIFDNLEDIIQFLQEQVSTDNVYNRLTNYNFNYETLELYKPYMIKKLENLGANTQEIEKIFFILAEVGTRLHFNALESFKTTFIKIDKLLGFIREEITLDNVFQHSKKYNDFVGLSINIFNLIALGCQYSGGTEIEISKLLSTLYSNSFEYYGFISRYNSFEELLNHERLQERYFSHSKSEIDISLEEYRNARDKLRSLNFDKKFKRISEKKYNNNFIKIRIDEKEAVLIKKYHLEKDNENIKKWFFNWIINFRETEPEKIEKILNFIRSISMANIIEKITHKFEDINMNFFNIFKDEIKDELELLNTTKNEKDNFVWILNNEDLFMYSGIKDVINYIRKEITISNVYEEYKSYNYSISFLRHNEEVFIKKLVKLGVEKENLESFIEILKYKDLQGYKSIEEIKADIEQNLLNVKGMLNDKRYKKRKIRNLSLFTSFRLFTLDEF